MNAAQPVRRPLRERLMSSVVDEVAERGYESTTVAGICRRAGIRTAGFQRHFGSKEACFLAAGEAFAGEILARVRAALETSRDWHDGVSAGLAAFLAHLAGHPTAARAFLVDAMAAGPDVLAVRDVTMHAFAGFFQEFRDRTGEVDGPSALISEAAVGGIYEIVARRVRDGATASLPDLLPALTYYLLAPVVDRPRRAARSDNPPALAATREPT